MCLSLGMYHSVQANTPQSKDSISHLKILMVAELCVSMCKMFIFQDIFNGLMELITLLILYFAYSQISFCWCIIYILYCMYQIMIYIVVLLTMIQNGTPLLPGGLQSAQSVLMVLLSIFYIVGIYFGFQAYKNFKAEIYERGGLLMGISGNDNEAQQNYGGSGQNQSYGEGRRQQNQQQPAQSQGQYFSGQGVRIG